MTPDPDTLPTGRHDGAILRLLRDAGPRSRTVLSAETGLSPTTVSKAVAPLVEMGYIRESASEAEARIGRPSVTLTAVPEAVTICGVQLGVGVAHLGLTDALARVRSSTSFTFDPAEPPESVLDRIAGEISSLLASHRGAPCVAIGVASPGTVDAERRRNLMAINLGWTEVPIADRLESRLGIPVVVDHNVRSMALAEARYGPWSGGDLAYVYVKTGLGLGLVLKGEPFYGGVHGASELGHIPRVAGGALCACGARGCLETVVSEPFLASRIQSLGLVAGAGASRDVLAIIEDASQAGDQDAATLRRDLIAHVSSALVSVVNLFNPEIILLGGIFADAPQSLLDDIRTATKKTVIPILREEFRLERPALANPGITAGAAVALERVFYGDRR